MRQAVILSVKQQQIGYQNKIINRKLGLLSSISIFVTIVACFSMLKVMNQTTTNQLFSIANMVYNPIQPLFSDASNVVFASANSLPQTEELKLSVPIFSSQMSQQNDHITFYVSTSIMVMSPERGVVQNVQVDPLGNKVITIQHSNDIKSKIIGCDVVGVEKGQVVVKGQEIATATVNGVIDFYILKNEQPTKLSMSHQNVSWQ